MYAIVKVGGKQYRVERGDSLLVDRMPEQEGAKLALEPLLYRGDKDDSVFAGDDLGKVKVEAVVKGHERGPKVHVLKFKPKRGYKRRYGYRADLTRIEIDDIKLLSRKPATKAAEKPAEEKPAAKAKPADEKPPAKVKPSAEKPAAKAKPATEKAAATKPATKKPAAKAKPAAAKAKPAAKKAAAKKPAARKPAAKKEDGDGS